MLVFELQGPCRRPRQLSRAFGPREPGSRGAMADDLNQTLDLLPFPPLRWREFFWAGRVVLNSWAGFQSRLGAYAGTSPGSAPEGTVRLRIAAPADDPPVPPTPEQVAAYEYLLAHQDAIRDTLVTAIFEEYPSIRH